MDRDTRAQNCAECVLVKKYDYGKKIYYCDHPDRIDDMGKIGVDDLPEIGPEWCPLRYGNSKNVESDLIEIKSDIQLIDKWGNPIYIRTSEPEYMCEIFGTQK